MLYIQDDLMNIRWISCIKNVYLVEINFLTFGETVKVKTCVLLHIINIPQRVLQVTLA